MIGQEIWPDSEKNHFLKIEINLQKSIISYILKKKLELELYQILAGDSN